MESEAEVLDVGCTTRLNHDDCSAGEDTRRRLYLTRPNNSPDIVLCYCHNCQEHAVIKRQQQSWRGPYSDTKVVTGQEFKEPVVTRDWEEWPPAAQAWLMMAGVGKTVSSWYGIAYDPSCDRMYLPIYTAAPEGEYLGYQLRSLDKLQGPKYLTALKNNDQSYYTRLRSKGDTQYMVIVEDLLSGLRVHEATHEAAQPVDVLVNYGVKVNIDALGKNRNAEKGYIVWLDNDGTNVHERANEIARTWRLITCRPTTVITDRQDPKHYTNDEILKILEDAIG